jgi:hypothetical protein
LPEAFHLKEACDRMIRSQELMGANAHELTAFVEAWSSVELIAADAGHAVYLGPK